MALYLVMVLVMLRFTRQMEERERKKNEGDQLA
jgi:hypothetical protein